MGYIVQIFLGRLIIYAYNELLDEENSTLSVPD
jgi:hypothetical protein